jgi:hypothetical protein
VLGVTTFCQNQNSLQKGLKEALLTTMSTEKTHL